MSQKAQYIYAVKGTFRWLSIVKTSQLIYIHTPNDLIKRNQNEMNIQCITL